MTPFESADLVEQPFTVGGMTHNVESRLDCKLVNTSGQNALTFDPHPSEIRDLAFEQPGRSALSLFGRFSQEFLDASIECVLHLRCDLMLVCCQRFETPCQA